MGGAPGLPISSHRKTVEPEIYFEGQGGGTESEKQMNQVFLFAAVGLGTMAVGHYMVAQCLDPATPIPQPTLASVTIASSISPTGAGYDTVRDVPIGSAPTPILWVANRRR